MTPLEKKTVTKAGELCSRDVVVAPRDMSVADAARLMRSYHVGTLVVCDEIEGKRGKPVGIVTDRDIVVAVVAPELRADVVTVGYIMERDLATAGEAQDVREVVEIMRHRGVRRLPIVDAGGRLVGVLAMDDVLKSLAEELTAVAQTLALGQIREEVRRA